MIGIHPIGDLGLRIAVDYRLIENSIPPGRGNFQLLLILEKLGGGSGVTPPLDF
jgi:hypothetical protein